MLWIPSEHQCWTIASTVETCAGLWIMPAPAPQAPGLAWARTLIYILYLHPHKLYPHLPHTRTSWSLPASAQQIFKLAATRKTHIITNQQNAYKWLNILIIGELFSVLRHSRCEEIVQWWYNARTESQTVAQHCTSVAFQHHEEISLFEKCLCGSHIIGVIFVHRSLAQLRCFVNFPPGDNYVPIILIM